MTKKLYTKIIGTGSYLPKLEVDNKDFLQHKFYDKSLKLIDKDINDIIEKFEDITKINKRLHADENILTSDMAAVAVAEACKDANIDIEDLDFIVVGHNFGDIQHTNRRVDNVPSLANKIKMKLKIKNPKCMAHDVISGCPGWTQGMIIANAYIKSGFMNRGAVVGADILSRVSDPSDRDSMIYADGAGATIVEGKESETPIGIIAHAYQSDSANEGEYLKMGAAYNPNLDPDESYIKMSGHKLYLYAIKNVPTVVKESIEQANIDITDIKKVFIHQANEKMDDVILARLFKLYNINEVPKNIMPMTIRNYGNSSTATVPTVIDLVAKGKLDGHKINSGDYSVMCSVGAGMNINSIVYRW